MGFLFERPNISDTDIIKQSKKSINLTTITAKNNLQSIISIANQKLAIHKNDYELIQTKNALIDYCNCISHNGIGALDTETTGLNPMLVDIVGLCLYTPGRKGAYVPINHISNITFKKIPNQLSIEDVSDVLKNLKTRWVMHNAKYDIRVCRHTLGIDLDCFWDTNLAANCINENESHRLKDLHFKYCDGKDEESLTFDTLFNGVTFNQVPISTAYLYAAGDGVKTFELFEYQNKILNRRNSPGQYNVFMNIEMPVLKVCCDMEDRGVSLDNEICNNLLIKYKKIKEERFSSALKVIDSYSDKINAYKSKTPNNKLSDPINISSPVQLAILLYDILKLKSPNKDSPRGTGVDILKELSEGSEKELCQSISAIREVDKLLSTYIEKMPAVALEDKKVHCSFNQYGAKTGRFSSSNPNLQNIPSHNTEIRKMFRASDGYVLVGGDFSQQEPKLTAHLSNDRTMIQAFLDGKDIYSTIAALAFNTNYEDCLEFRADGTTNKEGKNRRTQAKSIVLGRQKNNMPLYSVMNKANYVNLITQGCVA